MRAKILFLSIISTLFLIACNTGNSKSPVMETKKIETLPMVGGDRDVHGCIGSAGYQWSILKNECIRAWELKLKFKNLKVQTQGGWLLLSDDKKKAEFFGIEGTQSVLFDVKLGKDSYYESTDGKYYLSEKSKNHWQVSNNANKTDILFDME